jgi:hypothetical protein
VRHVIRVANWIKMGWAGHVLRIGEIWKYYKNFNGNTWREEAAWDTNTYERIIFKWILYNWGVCSNVTLNIIFDHIHHVILRAFLVILKMEAENLCETLIDLYQITLCYIP